MINNGLLLQSSAITIMVLNGDYYNISIQSPSKFIIREDGHAILMDSREGPAFMERGRLVFGRPKTD